MACSFLFGFSFFQSKMGWPFWTPKPCTKVAQSCASRYSVYVYTGIDVPGPKNTDTNHTRGPSIRVVPDTLCVIMTEWDIVLPKTHFIDHPDSSMKTGLTRHYPSLFFYPSCRASSRSFSRFASSLCVFYSKPSTDLPCCFFPQLRRCFFGSSSALLSSVV